MPQRIDDLTCCRAIFAAWVFCYHLNLQLFNAEPFGFLAPVIRRGYLGVDGFFILSGLVLALAHPHLPLAWRSVGGFWGRRFWRLYPVHISVIMLLALLLVLGAFAGMVPRDPDRFSAEELLRNLLLIHGWGLAERWAWNYPSWSISTEWAGYLGFPALWLALRRASAWQVGLLLAVLLACLAMVEILAQGAHLNLTYRGGLARFVPEFVAGMALARLRPTRVAWLAPVGLGVVLLGCLAPRALVIGDTLVVAGLFALLAGLMARAGQGREGWLARLPGLVFLGTISYSFYMSFAVVEMVHAVLWRRWEIAPNGYPLLFAFSSTAMTFALALLLWRCIEQPSQAFPHLAKRATSL